MFRYSGVYPRGDSNTSKDPADRRNGAVAHPGTSLSHTYPLEMRLGFQPFWFVVDSPRTGDNA
jgi:hypothetical protein